MAPVLSVDTTVLDGRIYAKPADAGAAVSRRCRATHAGCRASA
jgi:hypothetical protein